MAENYIAWNGDEYPWPPPDGWEKKGDGRYWPADQSPPESDATTQVPVAETAAPEPPAVEAAPPGPPAVVPPDAATPPVQMTPPPGMAPPGAPEPGNSPAWAAAPGGPPQQQPIPQQPGMTPPGYTTAGPPEKKGMSRGMKVLLVLLGLLVLVVGGCIVLIASFSERIVDAIDNVTEDIEQAERAVDFSECGETNGQLVAAGTITNERGITTSYIFSIVFLQPDDSRITSEAIEIADVEPGETSEFRATAEVANADGQYRCIAANMFLDPLEFGN